MSTSSESRRSGGSVSTDPNSPATTTSSQDQNFSVNSGDIPWILHHVLHPECAAELPLTFMFRFNSGGKPPSVSEVGSWWQLDRGGVLLRQIMSSLDTDLRWKSELDLIEEVNLETMPEEHPLDHDYDFHMLPENQDLIRKGVRFAELEPETEESEPENPKEIWSLDKYLPRKHAKKDITIGYEDGLPPLLIKKLVEKAFPTDYARATFTNALKALDYLRDIEFTRRAQLRAVGRRWGVDEENWRHYFGANAFANALHWYERMERIETQIQKWFAEIYVGLRIWIMLDTIKTTFDKNDIFAMLNTLYPPTMLSVPSDEISITQLKWHRRIIFSWILTIEKEGSDPIITIEEQLLRGKHSWAKVTLCLCNYLKHAIKQIVFARKIPGPHPVHNYIRPLQPMPPTNPPSLDPIWIKEIEYEEKVPWLATLEEDMNERTGWESAELGREGSQGSLESFGSEGSESTIRASCLPAPLFAGSNSNAKTSDGDTLREVDVVSDIVREEEKEKERKRERKMSFGSLRGMFRGSVRKRGGVPSFDGNEGVDVKVR